MKNIKNITSFILVALLAFSCGEEKVETKEPSNTNSKKRETVCLYQYSDKASSASWQAFKFNERVGVKGKITDVTLKPGKQNAESLKELFEGSAFKAMTNSVNSGNEERDMKLVNFFFGNLNEGEVISGEIKSLEGDNEKGIMNINLKINGIGIVTPFNYFMNEANKLSASATINLEDYKANLAIESINKQCDELHKGADGISKLWPDVIITLNTDIKVDCR